MKNDLKGLEIKIGELEKQVEEDRKDLTLVSKDLESKMLQERIQRNIREIEYFREFIDLNTMIDCTHLYVMDDQKKGKNHPYCIKCGLDSLYLSSSKIKTTKQMNIYSICNPSFSHLPYGIPRGEFLTDQMGNPLRCNKEKAYSICQEILNENPDIEDDTLSSLFLERVSKKQTNKKLLKRSSFSS